MQGTDATQAFPLFWVCGFVELLVLVMSAPESWTTYLFFVWLLLAHHFPIGAVKRVFIKMRPALTVFMDVELCPH